MSLNGSVIVSGKIRDVLVMLHIGQRLKSNVLFGELLLGYILMHD